MKTSSSLSGIVTFTLSFVKCRLKDVSFGLRVTRCASSYPYPTTLAMSSTERVNITPTPTTNMPAIFLTPQPPSRHQQDGAVDSEFNTSISTANELLSKLAKYMDTMRVAGRSANYYELAPGSTILV
jgi:hypothetical protein